MASLGKGKLALRRMFAAMNRRLGRASATAPGPPAAASAPDPPSLPAWQKGRFTSLPGKEARSRALGAAVDRSAEALRRRPLRALAALALLLLLCVLDLSTLARRLHVDFWLHLSADEAARAAGNDPLREYSEDGLMLSTASKDRLGPLLRSAVGNSALLRLPLGSWDLPPRMRSLSGILLPEELRGARGRGAVEVSRSSAWAPSSPAKDMDRTRIAREGTQGRSPYGPAYAGDQETGGKENKIRLTKGLFTGAVASINDVRPSEGYLEADSAERREVPKGAKPEDMAAEMMAGDDLLKSLQQYAKDTGWKKLEKTNQNPPPNSYDGNRLLTSDSVMQLLQTKKNADSSMKCALCSVEDRVTDNRATYFGEKF